MSAEVTPSNANVGHVVVQPSGHEFFIQGQETILEAALRAGVPLSYGCSGGSCGLCKAKWVSGEINKTRFHDYVRTEADKRDGMVLMCSNSASGDVVIEAGVAGGAEEIPLQHIAATVKVITPLTSEMVLLHLRTPRTNRLRFLAGQSVKLVVNQELSAILPIASCPCDDHNILFHVRRTPNNPFADYVFNQLKNNEQVEIHGPQGQFLFQESGCSTLNFFAFDTGFAPIKSLIDHAMSLDTGATVYLYWIGSSPESIYMPNMGRAWADALDNFHFAPIVAAFDVANLADGNEAKFDDLLANIRQARSDFPAGDVYIAGPDASVKKAQQVFLATGVTASQLVTYARVDQGAFSTS